MHAHATANQVCLTDDEHSHWTDLIYSYYHSKPVSLTAVGQKKRLVRDGINAYDAVQVRVD
ncbi:MAG: hypothetical protein WCS99_21495, partial [Limisphaerales bacterium]